ncbi:hypothetical protein ACNFIC_05025 [Pseudomonas sp. NY15463]|uniref:hypothetical protein n=1 Tax=Pseudomonas sp. NY15463 TaxID=3400361 RepID=UPI003A85D7B9
MDVVNNLSASQAKPTSVSQSTAIQDEGLVSKNVAASAKTAGTADSANISPLAQLLSDAAARAAKRDASTDRSGLKAIAEQVTRAIHSPAFEQSKTARDAQIPASDNPQRLEQAQQATSFLNNKGSNPFTGLSMEQLSLIVYDDSGAFTTNERRAALLETGAQEEAWSRAVSQKLMDEYNRDGHMSPETIQGVLDYYKALPPIMEAQLPDEYEQDLNKLIDYAEKQQSSSKDQLQSLLDLVLAQRLERSDKTATKDA